MVQQSSLLLTDEEIWEIVGELETTYEEDLALVAKAQLKKVVEWLEKNKEERPNGDIVFRIMDSILDSTTNDWGHCVTEEWQSLLEEIREEN